MSALVPAVALQEVLDQLQGIADDIAEELREARRLNDQEPANFLRGERRGTLAAYDLLTPIVRKIQEATQ